MDIIRLYIAIRPQKLWLLGIIRKIHIQQLQTRHTAPNEGEQSRRPRDRKKEAGCKIRDVKIRNISREDRECREAERQRKCRETQRQRAWECWWQEKGVKEDWLLNERNGQQKERSADGAKVRKTRRQTQWELDNQSTPLIATGYLVKWV